MNRKTYVDEMDLLTDPIVVERLQSPSNILSPASKCPICLKNLGERAFPDSCLHMFCFECVLKLHKHLNTTKSQNINCPVCRTPMQNMIMPSFKPEDFQWSDMKPLTPLQCTASEFRKKIYSQKLHLDLVCESDNKELSQYYRTWTSQVDRIKPWLDREIYVLLNFCGSSALYDEVVGKLLSLLPNNSVLGPEFQQLVQSYFKEEICVQFLSEFFQFYISFYNIMEFDQYAFYYAESIVDKTSKGKKLKMNLYLDY